MLTVLQKLIFLSHKRTQFLKLVTKKLFSEKYIYPVSFINMTTNTLLYHSVEPVLEIFNKDENKDIPGVKELLTIYNNAFEEQKKNIASGEISKHPLIVLEGLDGSGKTTLGKRLAKKINATQWRTPPNSISHLRNLFDNNKVLRTAFYSLGNYIAGLEVQMILKYEPVVMDRYWHSTAAYAIAQAVADDSTKYKMPASGDAIYCWPTDLFKPDIVILLEVSENNRLERHSRRGTSTTQEELLKSSSNFRENVLWAYKNMYNPGIQVVNGNYSFSSTLRQLEGTVMPLFN